jgi:hypothetical protein
VVGYMVFLQASWVRRFASARRADQRPVKMQGACQQKGAGARPD